MDGRKLTHFLCFSSARELTRLLSLCSVRKPLEGNLDMDEAITEFDVAMDLITLLFLGSERRVYSDRDGALEKAIGVHLKQLPASFSEFFGVDDPKKTIKSQIAKVFTAATELEMIAWVGDDLDQFEIGFDEKNAALRAAAINTPVDDLKETGKILCHSIATEIV
jgi:hypothetical protein